MLLILQWCDCTALLPMSAATSGVRASTRSMATQKLTMHVMTLKFDILSLTEITEMLSLPASFVGSSMRDLLQLQAMALKDPRGL